MTRLLESLLAQQSNCKRDSDPCRNHCRRCNRTRDRNRKHAA